ncbi:MAG: hypothetical protein M3291_03205 [Actinomycetota bacterium]|nr:hypothetical protein [Actinomycetota bacterium]
MFGVVETTGTGLRHTGPETVGHYAGVRIEHATSSFELTRDHPSTQPVYYRVGYGKLEWGSRLADFLDRGVPPVPDPGWLLALIQGEIPAPDSTPVPGVQRLSVGTAVRVDSAGVTVGWRRPTQQRAVAGLAQAVADSVGASEFAIAYSGGLSSAFVAASALRAGRRPLLLHADLGAAVRMGSLAEVPGLEVQRKVVDPLELLDHHPITGDELLPPMPDIEVPRRMLARLATDTGVPIVSGGLLTTLTSVKLPDVQAGLRGWRLLGCEPFHISGTLRTLTEARELLGKGVVYSPDGPRDGARSAPDAQPVGAPPPPSPTGGAKLPGLTAVGRQALETAHRGSMAVWQDHLDSLGPALGRLTAGLEERGDGGALLPALDPGVLAAVAAVRPARLGHIRRGMLRTHLPLRRMVAAHGIDRVDESSTGFWLRLAAAVYLHRERDKIISELERGCALADLGLIEPAVVTRTLRDGRLLAELALPLLRMVWIDRWLRGRS